ncbi:hypothetical protein PPL_04568 [Heterostelium album PN500]|uniref:Uncharacterized protein n=1 Tax=Heterostelium pallidum (strain ATCC 26659 / Pp 5 / PN500) TaxID=670386 RepID=D3B7Y0_HETP5|nr:hypothetical protein PPL_04568 [Heterostelium album PN500]EFA82148.1 hypothetical protein PPL_04568 [Heterostelium album PN500]|eukprot:XP_020434265.1 hypothetical protein PPL_04568 [Heterostelium album PN500]
MDGARMLQRVPSIIYNADNPSTYQPMMTPTVGIVLQKNNNPVPLNSSMVTVLFRYMTITEQDQFPRKIEIIKGVKCTFYDNPLPSQPDKITVYTNDAICPEKPVDVTVKRKTIYNAPRFIFDYQFGDFYTLGAANARTVDLDQNSTLLFKAYIRLDDYENNEFRQSQPFLNLIGSWGALWTFFSLTILNLISLYNKKKYERESQLNEMVQNVMKNNSHQTDIEMDVHNKHLPKNILNSSSAGSLEHFGWSPQNMSNYNNSSFTLTTSNDLNISTPNGTINSHHAPNTHHAPNSNITHRIEHHNNNNNVNIN